MNQSENNLYNSFSGNTQLKNHRDGFPNFNRRDKYRPRNCNGDAISRFELESIAKKVKENLDPFAVGAPVNVKSNSPVTAVCRGQSLKNSV